MAQYLKMLEAILSLFQGNMLYFVYVIVKEYLDLQHRLVSWAIELNLTKYLNIQSFYFACVLGHCNQCPHTPVNEVFRLRGCSKAISEGL